MDQSTILTQGPVEVGLGYDEDISDEGEENDQEGESMESVENWNEDAFSEGSTTLEDVSSR